MKSINHKGRKGSSQRSQRTEFNGYIFAYFAFLSTVALAEVDFVCSAVKYFFCKSLKHLILL